MDDVAARVVKRGDYYGTCIHRLGYLKSTNTFDRLRAVKASDSRSVAEAKSLLSAFLTLTNLHLRLQMQATKVGEPPSDWMDPGKLHKSQQKLLKDTLKTIQKVQQSLASTYVQWLGDRREIFSLACPYCRRLQRFVIRQLFQGI